MSSRLLACTLLLLASANWAAAQCCPAMGGCSAKPADLPVNTADDCARTATVGQIVIVGNSVTPQNVILRQIAIAPGQVISYPDLRAAEANLQKLNIFENDPDGTGVRPTVEVLDPEGVTPVKDILVTVQEKCGAFRCGPGDDDEDEEVPTKAKCGCDDCSCCGCMNKPGAECCCKGECKCCGCKTVDTIARVSRGFTLGLLVFCDKADDGCACDKDGCKCEKGKCDCCKKDDGSDCASGKGEDGKCSCDCSKGKCCCEGKCCQDGKCCCEEKKTSCCPFCPPSGCSLTWRVMEELCPALKICAMCPWMQEQVKEVFKPCMKCFVAQCKQVIKEYKAKATSCPAEEGACEEAGEPQAKKSCHGCGQCADAAKKSHVWHVRVFPSGKVLIGWKCGTEKAKHESKDEECPCATENEGQTTENDKEAEPAKTVCPYLQKQQQKEKEKTVSAADLYQQLGTPLENLAKLEKAAALCKRAKHFCEAGQYERAIKCYQKAKAACPGSRWEVTADEGMQVAQAMKEMDEKVRAVTRELMEKLLDEVIQKQAASTTEESEPAKEPVKEPECEEPVSEEPLPCREPEAMRQYKEKFTDLLEQAKSACATGDLDKARILAQEAASLATPEVTEKVKALIESARDCFNSGCSADGWEMLHTALMLDPGCEEARTLQAEVIVKELSNRCTECDGEPCDTLPPEDEDATPCPPGDRYDPEGGPDQNGDPGCVGDCEEQEGCFLIELQEEDLDLVPDGIAQCDETAPADLQEQVKQLVDLIRDNISVDVDCSKSQAGCARMWVQIGCIEYQASFNAYGPNFICMKVNTPATADIKAAQQTNIDETIHWIEAMNSGEKITDGDSEEAEEPLYMLETDLDPDW